MENTNYESVEKLIKLPNRRHIIPVHESLFVDLRQFQKPNVSMSIKQGRKEFIDKIQKELEVFDDATSFVFRFPESKFPDVPVGQRNNITYQQRMEVIQQDTFKDKLSSQQIAQMRQKGEFEVKSNMKNVSIPYVWKVNDTLLRGRVNIVNIWQNGLAWCYAQLYDSAQTFKEVIPKSIKKIKVIPQSFFTLIFGRRSLSEVYTPHYSRQVYKDFWTDILNNQLKDLNNEVSHQFLQRLYLKYEPAIYEQVKRSPHMKQYQFQELKTKRNNKIQQYNNSLSKKIQLKQRLIDIENKFQSNWLKIRRRILTKISNQVTDNNQKITDNEEELLKGEENSKKDEQILDKLSKEKYLIYTAHLKQNLPKQNFSSKCIQALTFLITLISIFQNKMQIKNEKLRKQKEKITKDIQNKHRIKSKHWRFKNDLINQIYTPISQQIQNQFYQKLIQQNPLDKLFPEKYQSAYTKYVALKRNFDSLIEQKKSNLKRIFIPERVFKSTYLLLPPYEVINNNGYYSLKRQVQMYIDTSTHFWKFKLYAMRIKCWTINCAIFLLGFAWVGPLGLRCLYGTQPFKYDEYCQYDTGLKQYQYRKPFLAVFSTVLDGIRESRRHFQQLPDRGLFGKKFSRYFNYFQCYVFRLFFVGIVGVLILYPILIVLLSVLSIVLVFTIWFWVPIIMAVCYLFNILVFQFESSYNYHNFRTKGLPLIRIIWIVIGCLLSILFSLLRLIISPVICALYTLMLLIQRGFRTFTDKIMLFLISKLGRTPSRDTSIARKISGPGMSRSYFYSINQQDVYILTLSSLEQIFVNKFLRLTRQKIESSTKKYNQIMDFALYPFGYNQPSLPYGRNVVTENKNKLLDRFNTQSSQYLARYPNIPYNIRFTEQELDQYFDNSIKIVKNFVQRHQIQSWVFSQNNVLDEDYEQLTRVIWIEVFNCGEQIFEPLETIDGRFRISEEVTTNTIKMKQSVGSVMKALQGQIKLTHRAPNFNPAKISLLDKDAQISILRKICAIHNQNNGISIQLNLNDPSYILICQRNLEELKKYDNHTRNQILERYDKKFEE